jgi:hypothetical protein
MNTKTYLLALIVSSLFLAATGMTSPLQAQTETTTKTPLSFYGLGNDQAIRFLVNAKHTHYGAAFVSFEVEVSDQPQPEAKIRLCINASMIVPQVEKEWGHHVGEKVTRSLTPGDLQTLENFLTAARARGALSPPALSGHPAIRFSLITQRMAKEGFKRSDIDKNEFYNTSEEAERDFVKNFIGFNESGSN